MAAMRGDIDAAIGSLDDYVRGHMPDAAAQDYEEDLFARALSREAPELTWRDEVGRVLSVMKKRGTLNLWLTARGVDELLDSGLRVLQITVDPAMLADQDLAGDFDILVTKVPIDLTGVQKLDAEVYSSDGSRLLKTMPDIPFDPTDGAVYACCEAELARAASSVASLTRVWATDDAGRRLIGEIRSV
ncbi:MAG: hypothetical protein ABW133_17245 [Polyangiaceae bacterium]